MPVSAEIAESNRVQTARLRDLVGKLMVSVRSCFWESRSMSSAMRLWMCSLIEQTVNFLHDLS
jgi:hypothetical protein